MTENLTICKECKNHVFITERHRCYSKKLLQEKGTFNVVRGRLEFADGELYQYCVDINTDGHCQYFEPKSTQPSKPVKPSRKPIKDRIMSTLVNNLKPLLK